MSQTENSVSVSETLLTRVRSFLEFELATQDLSDSAEQQRLYLINQLSASLMGPLPDVPDGLEPEVDTHAANESVIGTVSVPVESVYEEPDFMREEMVPRRRIKPLQSHAHRVNYSIPIEFLQTTMTLELPRKSSCQSNRFSAGYLDHSWTLAGRLKYRLKSGKWTQLNVSFLTANAKLTVFKNCAKSSTSPQLCVSLCGVHGIYAARESGVDHVIKIINPEQKTTAVLAAYSEHDALIWIDQINQYSNGNTPSRSICLFMENAASSHCPLALSLHREIEYLPESAAATEVETLKAPCRMDSQLSKRSTLDAIADTDSVSLLLRQRQLLRQSGSKRLLGSMRRKVEQFGVNKRWSVGPLASPFLNLQETWQQQKQGEPLGHSYGWQHLVFAAKLLSDSGSADSPTSRTSMRNRGSLPAPVLSCTQAKMSMHRTSLCQPQHDKAPVQGEVLISVPGYMNWCKKTCRIYHNSFEIFHQGQQQPVFRLALLPGTTFLDVVRDKTQNHEVYSLSNTELPASRLHFYVEDKLLVGTWIKALLDNLGITRKVEPNLKANARPSSMLLPPTVAEDSPHEDHDEVWSYHSNSPCSRHQTKEANCPVYDQVFHPGKAAEAVNRSPSRRWSVAAFSNSPGRYSPFGSSESELFHSQLATSANEGWKEHVTIRQSPLRSLPPVPSYNEFSEELGLPESDEEQEEEVEEEEEEEVIYQNVDKTVPRDDDNDDGDYSRLADMLTNVSIESDAPVDDHIYTNISEFYREIAAPKIAELVPKSPLASSCSSSEASPVRQAVVRSSSAASALYKKPLMRGASNRSDSTSGVHLQSNNSSSVCFSPLLMEHPSPMHQKHEYECLEEEEEDVANTKKSFKSSTT
ncbi:hypothetical protein Ciccas_002028 [Cichlidogyrus casuarinus]|uniref:PH domain-containing protein n=1 Tax=Cichlidogyrus casuarinus TaxID=1844966 RepID=A0ABD2QIQ8_9PLAT